MSDYVRSMLPADEKEKLIVSTEMLVLSVQAALQKEMTKRGVSQSELASRLGMSLARVSQIFSDRGPNLTLKTIARVAAALDADLELAFSIKGDELGASSRTMSGPQVQWHESSPANDLVAPKNELTRLRSIFEQHRPAIWRDGELERRAA